MKITIKQRAISPTQKAERRRAILDIALELNNYKSFSEINMSEIAKKAGIAKGTLFLYFNTKEELFLTLAMDAYQKWFEATDSGIERLLQAKITNSIDEIIKVFHASFNLSPILIKLIGIVGSVLEQNISYSSALNFKLTLIKNTVHTGSLLEQYFTFLKPGEGVNLLLRIQALAIGFQNLAEPAPIVREVLENEKLDIFKLNFDDQLFSSIKLLLIGLKNR